ncbi:MAG TPA: winged helix-turn-helix domain-containing protein, partial [Pyrinomonadaceae bacterium]
MPHTPYSCYEFGPYRLNPTQRLLTRDGELISLTPKAIDILTLLVMNAGRLVEKDDLLREVWTDTFVEDANLAQNIFTLRRALGDERAGPKYIETVPRHGYRFIASVKACNGEEPEASEAEPESLPNDDIAPPPRIVIAVLPFINATDDDSLEYLAEGVTDNTINHLSRVSALRVMSRSAVFRHKRNELDPQVLGKELGANAVLVGTISARPKGIAIGVELVDVATGWQLWGESFDSESKDLLEIQDAITRQLLVNLKLKLTGEEEKRVTARYTENAQAYQAYLEGRYHWSRYTRTGMQKAIGHFREAIKLDPNYALAYSAIVDCHLRLATNYLPPEGASSASSSLVRSASDAIIHKPIQHEEHALSDMNIKLRFEWDWKGAERESRRATELNTDYPAAHQWYAAYVMSEEIYRFSGFGIRTENVSCSWPFSNQIPIQITLLQPTSSELVQVSCTIAREQIDIGNYEAAAKILKRWWSYGEWPTLEGLNLRSTADLLFTAGELAGCMASTKQLPKGQKHGEALLNGSIAMLERLRCKRFAAEAQIELSLCYYRQGLFDLGRSILERVLKSLSASDAELRSLALVRLACLERHAGRLNMALTYLNEATAWIGFSGPWTAARCHLELASTYKDLGVSERVDSYFDLAEKFYLRALWEFQAVGNHRLTAIAENNLGVLLLLGGRFVEAESRLEKARNVFDHFGDRIRCAQADDSL